MRLSKLVAAGVIFSLFSFGVCQIQDGVAHSTGRPSAKQRIRERRGRGTHLDHQTPTNIISAFKCGSATADIVTHDDSTCTNLELPANTGIVLSYGMSPEAGTKVGVHFPVIPPKLIDLNTNDHIAYLLKTDNFFPTDVVVFVYGTANGNPITLVKCGADVGVGGTEACGWKVFDRSGWNPPNESFTGQILVSSFDVVLYGTQSGGNQVTILNGFEVGTFPSPSQLPVSTQVTGCPTLPDYPCVEK